MIHALLLDNELFLGGGDGGGKTLTRKRLDPCILNMKCKIRNMLQIDKRTK